jgi:hypothetical protein
MNNGDILIENLSDQQNPNVNNQKVENSAQDQLNLERVNNVHMKEKKRPSRNRTQLYILSSFFLLIIE